MSTRSYTQMHIYIYASLVTLRSICCWDYTRNPWMHLGCLRLSPDELYTEPVTHEMHLCSKSCVLIKNTLLLSFFGNLIATNVIAEMPLYWIWSEFHLPEFICQVYVTPCGCFTFSFHFVHLAKLPQCRARCYDVNRKNFKRKWQKLLVHSA